MSKTFKPFGLCDADVHWVHSMCLSKLADKASAVDFFMRSYRGDEPLFNTRNAYILYCAYRSDVFVSDLLVSLVDQPDCVGIPTGNVRIQGDVFKHQIAFPDGMRYIPDYAINCRR